MSLFTRIARPVALVAVLLICISFTGVVAAAQVGPVNLDLEQGELGQVPTGWFFPGVCAEAGYSAKLTDDRPKQGQRCAVLAREGAARQQGFGNLLQSIDAAAYRGKRVRFKAAVRAEVAGFGNRAMLWLRVDRKNGEPGFFDNMADRPITAKEWRDYEIVGDVADDAAQIVLGLMLLGNGKAWLDAVSFEVLGKAGEGNEAPRPLQGRGRENLVAFTRLLGYVRYFHPSDEAAAVNWETFAIEGFHAAEKAKDPAELAQVLARLFQPVAPTVQVFPTGGKPEQMRASAEPADRTGLKVLAWRHYGVGTGSPMSIYSSKRVNLKDVADKEKKGPLPRPEQGLTADLGGGVSCVVPLALYADDKGTLPHRPTQSPAPATKPKGFRPSGDDRATRLAGVALAWNTFQHFYPYFDVVKTDWPAALRQALTAAATDRDGAAFLDTLRRLVAELHDGHGNVFGGAGTDSAMPPILWDWVEDRLVITRARREGAEGLRAGDVVLMVDGKPAAEALAAKERLISGATVQWRRYRALRDLAAGSTRATLTLEVQRGAEPPRTVTLRRTADSAPLQEPRPDKIAEIKPGIFYVDLDRVLDAEFQAALPKLEKATGIIFDLRGYPRISTAPLAHLIDKPITCAQWHIPVVYLPDRKDMRFEFSNWPVQPQKPRFGAKVAFLTDGRAISYAETYLGMVEHYKLADIVGGPTAGTNGNINPFTLPGGYNVVWTGMKVLKHDGSQHHGIGIRPTVPAARTLKGVAEGRDEVLEKALQIVGG
jgi:C-terminal processing protease CtpA/Prc